MSGTAAVRAYPNKKSPENGNFNFLAGMRKETAQMGLACSFSQFSLPLSLL